MLKRFSKYYYFIIVLAAVALIFTFFGRSFSEEPKDNVISNEQQQSVDDSVKNTSGSQTEEQTETTEPETTTSVFRIVLGEEYPYDIKSVDLSNESIADVKTLTSELMQLEALESVDMYGCDLSMDDMTFMRSELPEVHFGWNVELCGIKVDSSEESLDMNHVIVENLDDFIYRLSLLDLTYVDMCGCGLSNEQMEVLMDKFPQTKFVWEVTMGLWTIRTDRVAFSTLKDGSINYRLTNEDTQVLKYCTDMVALDIGHNKVTDLSFLQYMPNLKILILVDNWDGETDEHYIKDLSMLEYVPNLVYLEFFVGDVEDLSFLQYLPNLVDLNVSYNPISDVTYLLNLPHIERLFIEHTDLTEVDFELLKQTYPNAQVEYYGEGSVDHNWRGHERYYAMIDMYHNDYVSDLFK